MLRWHLYGAGLESLGKEDAPERAPLPEFGDRELLVRQDACGLCFSDTKVINLGENHPRLKGRNLSTDPVTLGHEVACTLVGIGASLHSRFHLGERFTIQADVFYQGASLAYGYNFKGGLAEYSVIPEAMIEGDEGCYLLPVKESTGIVEAALTEPWACVVSSYNQTHRAGIKPDGYLLAISSELHNGQLYDLVDTLCTDEISPIRTIFATDKLFHCCDRISGEEWGGILTDWLTLKEDQTSGHGFDDILIAGDIPDEMAEQISLVLADHGIVNFTDAPKFHRNLKLDIGRIHYNRHHFLSTTSQDPNNSYLETRTADILPGGVVWLIGAGGPMGQMHLQRAIHLKNPPVRIVATETNEVRFKSITDRFAKEAKERGVELCVLNPKSLSIDEFKAQLTQLSAGDGFDDIVCMVPSIEAIEFAQHYLSRGAWFNIFAGVARGALAEIDVNQLIDKNIRILGSSGSSLADMREVVSLTERGELSTNRSLAAIGGMLAAKKGLQAVREGWFPGKTLIFPLIPDLPLTALPDLKNDFPSVFEKLEEGQFWTKAAEAELFRVIAEKTNPS